MMVQYYPDEFEEKPEFFSLGDLMIEVILRD